MNNLTRHEKLAIIFIITALAFSFVLNIVFRGTSPTCNISYNKNAEYRHNSFEAKYKVNINTATKKELESVKGIGPVLADRIIVYRTQNGNFTEIEAIKNIKGISENTLNKIKDKISIE